MVVGRERTGNGQSDLVSATAPVQSGAKEVGFLAPFSLGALIS